MASQTDSQSMAESSVITRDDVIEQEAADEIEDLNEEIEELEIAEKKVRENKR
jgi:outer membrane cobalamin receptor